MDSEINKSVKPPDSRWQEEESWKEDSSADKENNKYNKLEELEVKKNINRIRVHHLLGWLVPVSMTLAFFIFWIGVIVYAIHMLTPFQWLTADQLRELHTILFSGTLGAVVAQGVSRYID